MSDNLLQDLIDRYSLYTGGDFPPTALDPYAPPPKPTKKGDPFPTLPKPTPDQAPVDYSKPENRWMPPQYPGTPQQANQPPAITALSQNAANQAYGQSPMSVPRPEAPALPPWTKDTRVGALTEPTIGQFTAATPPRTAEPEKPKDDFLTKKGEMPYAVDSAGIRRLPGIPQAPSQREADGSNVDKTNDPGKDDDQAARPVVMQAGDQAGMFGGGGVGGGFLDKLSNFFDQHRNQFAAMGAGLLGAPTLAQGLSRAMSYGIQGRQMDIAQQTQDIAQQTQLAGQQATFNALRTAGFSPDMATMGAANPKALDKMMDQLTGPKYDIQKIEETNSWGEKVQRMVAIDPRDPTRAFDLNSQQWIGGGAPRGGQTVGTMVMGANGQPVTIPRTVGGGGGRGGGGGGGIVPAAGGGGGPAPTGGTGGSTLAQPGQSQFYAPGVTDQSYSENLDPESYLKQFSPSVQADILGRINGRIAPTGGGRGGGQQLQGRLNRAANLYGTMIGMPMDAVAVAQRKKFAEGLTSESPQTPGGKARALHQGLGHFVELADAIEELKLGGGLGIEKFANYENWFKSLTTAQQAKIARVQALGQGLAREMGTLTSSTGGGVGEREHTAKLISDVFGSPNKAGGALDGVMDIMQGGIDALVGQRDDLFPNGNYPRGADFITPKQQQQLEHVRQVAARLQGKPYVGPGGPDTTAPAVTSGTQGEVTWSIKK